MKSLEHIASEALLLPRDRRFTLAHRILASVEPDGKTTGFQATGHVVLQETGPGNGRTMNADKATARVDIACNLDKRTSEVPPNAAADVAEQGTWRVEEKIYDSFGSPHTLRVEYRKVVGQPNQWQGTVTVDPEAPAPTNAGVALGPNPVAGISCSGVP